MSKFNHSFGPWFYTGSCVWGVTRDSNGDPEQYQIADSGEWDARLIACAPEMLDALIMAVRDTCEDCINLRIGGEIGYGCVGMTDPNCSSVRGYKALIEKATGMTMDEVLK